MIERRRRSSRFFVKHLTMSSKPRTVPCRASWMNTSLYYACMLLIYRLYGDTSSGIRRLYGMPPVFDKPRSSDVMSSVASERDKSHEQGAVYLHF